MKQRHESKLLYHMVHFCVRLLILEGCLRRVYKDGTYPLEELLATSKCDNEVRFIKRIARNQKKDDEPC